MIETILNAVSHPWASWGILAVSGAIVFVAAFRESRTALFGDMYDTNGDDWA